MRVANHQGAVVAECRVSERMRPGIAWMPFGGFGDAQGNACSVNTLTPEEPTDWGGGSGFYDAFVEVTRYEEKAVSTPAGIDSQSCAWHLATLAEHAREC